MIANFFSFAVIALFCLSSTEAFNSFYGSHGRIRPAKLSMIFNFFNNNGSKKAAPSAVASTKIASANKPATTASPISRFGEYIPAGVTKEQYEAVRAAEAKKKEENKKRFQKGKVTESLTEWLEENEKKGLTGPELNRKGHRMVKMKYEGWYTDQSPV